ncbi:hypothetical protein PALB_37300 [Pseudoalteromonas luteoviolacea B = ATCC 29581]|nr:hypothetical protein PALB_37300 [Pseudoalteromonas luteoviolacea B = ATCC 29581]
MKKYFAYISLLFLSTSTFAADVILFRHAEKQQGDDPALTEQGQIRALRLAKLGQTYKPSALYSTDYKRTQQTIAPLAQLTELPVTSYDPNNLASFAQTLKSLSGMIVVAGHSNTTPVLIKALSGKDWPIDESTYDDVFILKQTKSGYEFERRSSD